MKMYRICGNRCHPAYGENTARCLSSAPFSQQGWCFAAWINEPFIKGSEPVRISIHSSLPRSNVTCTVKLWLELLNYLEISQPLEKVWTLKGSFVITLRNKGSEERDLAENSIQKGEGLLIAWACLMVWRETKKYAAFLLPLTYWR